MVERGDVWLVALDPTVGREIKKTRPAVVLSPADLNDALATAIVAPMTTGALPAPFRTEIEFAKRQGRILLDQVRSIDRARLVRRLGRLDGKAVSKALRVLRDMFAE